MTNQKEFKLSSGWTNIGIYGSAILFILITPVIFSTMTAQEFHLGMILAFAIYLALAGIVIYQFIYACDATVTSDAIILKKQFRPATTYSFDKIGYPSSFQLKTTKYITVEMENDDKSMEKYLIINSNAILAFENKDAEEALHSLRNVARSK